jgi:hypothetical protein
VTRAPSRLRDFTKLHPGAEGILQRVGAATWDLLVIAVDGTWERAVFPDEASAEAACRELDLRVQRGWEDPRLGRRMNGRDQWNTADGQRRAR